LLAIAAAAIFVPGLECLAMGMYITYVGQLENVTGNVLVLFILDWDETGGNKTVQQTAGLSIFAVGLP